MQIYATALEPMATADPQQVHSKFSSLFYDSSSFFFCLLFCLLRVRAREFDCLRFVLSSPELFFFFYSCGFFKIYIFVVVVNFHCTFYGQNYQQSILRSKL